MPDVEGLQCKQGGDGEVTLQVYTPKEVTSHTGWPNILPFALKCLLPNSTSVAPHSPDSGGRKKKQRKVGFNTALAQPRVKTLEISHLVCEQHTRNNKNMTEVPQNKTWRVNTCPLESSPPVSSLPPPTQTDVDEGVSGSGSGCFGAGSGQVFRYRRCTSCFFSFPTKGTPRMFGVSGEFGSSFKLLNFVCDI